MFLLSVIFIAVATSSAFGANLTSLPLSAFREHLLNLSAHNLDADVLISARTTKHWPGWAGVANMYNFGDSWSDISYNISGPSPNPENPVGNPVYPTLNDSYGAVWPVYATKEYNDSFIKTFDLARAGSVANSVINHERFDLVHQVQTEFLPIWGSRNDSTWQPDNTLFVFFIGVNDVGIVVDNKFDVSSTFDGLMWTQMVLLDQLYKAGARNFLFLNVPPLDRVPMPMANIGPAVLDWNVRTGKLASNLSDTYSDTTVFQFDTHSMFGQFLDNVRAFPTTSHLTNLTGMCPAYDWIYQEQFDPSCGVPLSQFLWMNNLHPTYTIHNTMAAQVVEHLRA